MNTTISKCFAIVIFLVFTLVPCDIKAQSNTSWGTDTYEAWIEEQEAIHNMLYARTIDEATIVLTQCELKNKAAKFKQIEEQFDKYRKNFEIITILLGSAEAVYGAVLATDHIGHIADRYYNLLKDYKDWEQAYISADPKHRLKDIVNDTTIINTSTNTIKALVKESKDIYLLFAGLIEKKVAKQPITLREILFLVNQISVRIERCDRLLTKSYNCTYAYAMQRMHCWNPDAFRPSQKTRRDNCENPVERWRTAAVNSLSSTAKNLTGFD